MRTLGFDQLAGSPPFRICGRLRDILNEVIVCKGLQS